LDLFADTIGGSALRFFQDSVNTPAKAIVGEKVAIHEIPLLRRVMGDISEGVDSKIYYNNTTQVFTAEAELKAYKGTEYYPIMFQKLKPMVRLIGLAKDVESQISKLRKERNRYELIENKQAVEKLETKIRTLQKLFNKKFNLIEKAEKLVKKSLAPAFGPKPPQ